MDAKFDVFDGGPHPIRLRRAPTDRVGAAADGA